LQFTYRLFWFFQVVRKHTLGKVGTKTIVSLMCSCVKNICIKNY